VTVKCTVEYLRGMKRDIPNPMACLYSEKPEECFIIGMNEKPQDDGCEVKEEES